MRRFICRVIGHRWQAIMPDASSVSVCHVCLRCRENGWLIREY